jgi:hypothetical protein
LECNEKLGFAFCGVPLVLASDLEFLFGFFTCSVSPL